jgi:hypothetical protein
MRTFLCGAAALVLLTIPAAAQNSPSSQTKSVDPHQLAAQLKNRPLKLDDKQKAAIRDGLVAVHTQQKGPKDFKPQVGAKLPKPLKLDTLPEDLARKDPAFKELDYAKTATDILVLDPMTKTIIAVIPRKFAADPNAKRPTPVDWASRRGRELTGQAPQDTDNASQDSDSPGDPAAVGNGGAANGQPQESGLDPSYQGRH